MKNKKKLLVNAFIIFNIVTVLFSSNTDHRKQNSFQRFFYPYAFWTRILQKWNLFTPNPRHVAVYYRVEITFKDNTSVFWRRPEPENWDFFQRHLAYNWQKYDLASNHMEQPFMWDDIIHYMVQLYANDKNPPVKIRLSKMVGQWPLPKTEGYVFSDPKNLFWQDQTFFVYLVNEKRFL